MLEQFGAVRERQLEGKGRLIAGLRHDNELLVAEGVAHGVFDDVSGPEAAAVCSALIEEARSGDPALARTFLKKRPKLKRKLEQLMRVADTVHEAQRARHLRIPIAVHSGFMPAVFRWASGEDDWSAIVEEAFGGHEGDSDPGDAAPDRPAPSAGRQPGGRGRDGPSAGSRLAGD